MKCKYCGATVPDDAKVCEYCDCRLDAPEPTPAPEPEPAPEPVQMMPIPPEEPEKRGGKPSAKKMMKEGEQIGENIKLCSDGKYRWISSVNLFTNPTFLFLVWKIFFFILLGIFAVVTIVDAGNDDFRTDGFLNTLKMFGIITGGMTALVLIGYLVYAAIMGGKYTVLFELDEKGFNHKQIEAQAKKAKKIGAVTFLAGAAGGSLTTMGAGLNVRTEMYSNFERVKKVKYNERTGTIKIREGLSHNQVYCAAGDFAFVSGYITDRCPNAKK